jgi:acyl-coenzyme A thioesterase PaaI-like protein
VVQPLPSVPPGAPPPVPHPGAPPPGTVLGPHYVGCFGCGELPGGLRLRLTTGEGLTVTGTFLVETHHQGAPGLAHGGVVSAAFDEALGALQVFFGEPAVTGALQTEFRRPVPVASVLHLRAWVEARDGRKLWVSAEGRLDAPDGPVAARAGAVFVFVEREHFARHGHPAQVAAARAARRAGRREVNP